MKPQLDQGSRHTELVSIPPVLFTDNGVQASLPFKLPHFSYITTPLNAPLSWYDCNPVCAVLQVITTLTEQFLSF